MICILSTVSFVFRLSPLCLWFLQGCLLVSYFYFFQFKVSSWRFKLAKSKIILYLGVYSKTVLLKKTVKQWYLMMVMFYLLGIFFCVLQSWAQKQGGPRMPRGNTTSCPLLFIIIPSLVDQLLCYFAPWMTVWDQILALRHFLKLYSDNAEPLRIDTEFTFSKGTPYWNLVLFLLVLRLKAWVSSWCQFLVSVIF